MISGFQKFILTGAFALNLQLMFAQTSGDQKYIEVIVSDSSEVVPDIILYNVALITENAGLSDYDMAVEDDYTQPLNPEYAEQLKKEAEERKMKAKMMEKRFSDILSKEKISYTRKSTGYPYEYFYGKYQDERLKNFELKFTSFDQMEKFLEKVPEDIKYTGNISSLNSSKYDSEESKLIAKTLMKAKMQAETIAKFGNVKLGSLIQFSDAGSEQNQNLQQLMYSIYEGYEGSRNMGDSRKIVLRKTVRVRYAIE